MDKFSRVSEGDDNEGENMELPPGFRFHPTDEELISHYLSPKVVDNSFSARAIGEVDLNKCEPWDLPWRAKMGEKEWYFFCVKDRKYPTGLRTNRATEAGYWKATGKDKEIHKGKTLVGMKKTLVFYKGRAPKGEKSNWIMHEYRLEGKNSLYNRSKTVKNEWVICRVFQKNSSGKKTYIHGLPRYISHGNGFPSSSLLPPLMESSPYRNETITSIPDSSHVTCFSNSMEKPNKTKENIHSFITPSSCYPQSDTISPVSVFSAKNYAQNKFFSDQLYTNEGSSQYPDRGLIKEQSILKILFENQGPMMKRDAKTEFSSGSVVSNNEMNMEKSFEDYEDPSSSGGPINLDCLWSY